VLAILLDSRPLRTKPASIREPKAITQTGHADKNARLVRRLDWKRYSRQNTDRP